MGKRKKAVKRSSEPRGLLASESCLEIPPEAKKLAEQVAGDGGAALAA